MSLFRTQVFPCPSCGTPVRFDLVHSVNADRRPDLRMQILANTFQKQACPACESVFRVAPEFTYLHQGAKQWISIWPAARLDEAADLEQRSLRAFDMFYGEKAGAAAAALGRELHPRVVFGWEALHEKLVAVDAGIDDVSLELAKIALFSTLDGLAPGDEVELRLLGVSSEKTMVLGLFDTAAGTLKETLTVPLEMLDEIAADPDWEELREDLAGSAFVDATRLMLDAPQSA